MSKKYIAIEPIMCPRCNSQDIQFQLVNKQDLVPKRKSLLWWITIGWLWVIVKWIFFYWLVGLFVFVLKMLKPKKYKMTNTVENYKICKRCGYHWK